MIKSIARWVLRKELEQGAKWLGHCHDELFNKGVRERFLREVRDQAQALVPHDKTVRSNLERNAKAIITSSIVFSDEINFDSVAD